MRAVAPVALLAGLILLTGCKSMSNAAEGVAGAGEAVASGVSGAATSLVSVNLSNVLNDLALDLKIDKANIPINAQIPITIAANVCGVSINILSVSAGNQATCTAVTTSPQLTQAVQQQLSTGGGTQTTTGTTPTTTQPTTTTTTTPQPTTPQPTTPQQ